MSLAGRLRLDEVISSVPELGPTLPDGGYSWIVLAGAMTIQMTVPSIVSTYGIVLGFLTVDSYVGLDLWEQEIALTPILFTAFLCFADPWSRVIVNLASVPRLLSFIGVCLLTIGVLASGYLATGGVGAYLASSSAGAVMGIGGSFILVQTETVLRRNFRTRLRLALTLKDIATSLGFIFAPGLALTLLSRSSLSIGLLLMACSFIPTALGTLTLRTPVIRSRTSPYTLLISDEDNELTSRVNPNEQRQHNGNGDGFENGVRPGEIIPPGIPSEGNDVYSYHDIEDEQELFNITSHQMNIWSGFKQKCQVLKSIKFWVATVACVGCRAGSLFLWLLIPALTIVNLGADDMSAGVTTSIVAGIGCIVANAAAYWQPSTARSRSFCFGGASWLGALILIAYTVEVTLPIYIALAFFGGLSVGGTSACLESALLDAMGSQPAKKAHTVLSTIVGLSILGFSFLRSPMVCLQLTAAIQFLGGSYWILVPLLGVIRAR